MFRTRGCLLVLVLGAALQNVNDGAYADVCYYVGPDGGSWHVPDNWSSGHVPVDYAYIIDDLTVRVTADVPSDLHSALGFVIVGFLRDGTIVQDDGDMRVTRMEIGREEGGRNYKGSYILNGGAFRGEIVFLGRSTRDNTFVMNGGNMRSEELCVGYSDGDNTFVMSAGKLVVGSTLTVGGSDGSGQIPGSSGVGVFRQTGGETAVYRLVLEGRAHLGVGSAVYYLDDGTLTAAQMAFGSSSNSYFDFGRGVLNLPGNWDFDRLTSIPYSDFRVFGKPAAEGDLMFPLVVIDGGVYTQISVIPEPSTLVLLSMGALGLLGYGWRRQRSL